MSDAKEMLYVLKIQNPSNCSGGHIEILLSDSNTDKLELFKTRTISEEYVRGVFNKAFNELKGTLQSIVDIKEVETDKTDRRCKYCRAKEKIKELMELCHERPRNIKMATGSPICDC